LVVEHQLVGALVAVAPRELEDLADHAVVAETHALDDLAVTDVEAGDQASRKYGCNSSMLMRPSSRALPLMAAASPICARRARSAAELMPPEACQAMRGKRRCASAYSSMLGPASAPSREMSVHSTCLRSVSAKDSSSCHSDSACSSTHPFVRTRGVPPSSTRTSMARHTASGPWALSSSRSRAGFSTAALP